ncbi:MAG: beta-L-arabinofuranosidase domain-containing protein [Halobacteriaceae archaeon]
MSPTDDLRPLALDLLPLGDVRPRGWLRRQLEVQAEGLTGHLDEFHENLSDSAWRGGERWGHEQAPYYVDGLVPLAHLLDDPALRAKADGWVEAFLDAQDDHGYLGPVNTDYRPPYYPLDPWPPYVAMKALYQHHSATGDERAVEAMRAYCRFLYRTVDDRPLYSWSKFRWGDLAASVHRLYESTGEEWLLELADDVAEQGYDWRRHWEAFDLTDPVNDGDEPKGGDRYAESRHRHHVVTNAMGIKAPAVRWRRTGDPADRAASRTALEVLDEHHGQVTGVFSGDEHFGGRNPSRGTETCSVVEYMYCLERLLATVGDPAFGDRLERVGYNALPAAFTPDMCAHQYDQQVNQVLVTRDERPWTNGADANLFGVDHFCCTTNCHQGWPKFAKSLWMRDGDDALVAVAYGPSEVTTAVDGTDVALLEETAYPYDTTVRVAVDPETPAEFALRFRVPAWADGATVEHPDGEGPAEAGGYHELRREWRAGDEVVLSLPAEVEAVDRGSGVTLRRGPLVFSLPVRAEETRLGGDPPYHTREFRPTEPWNYGVDPDAGVEVVRSGDPEPPVTPDDPPVSLRVEGRRVPEWSVEDNWAAPVPADPEPSGTPETLRLVPYGSTTLRVTEFPRVTA